MRVMLFTATGGFVVSGSLPPFNKPPEVLTWGVRLFVHDGERPGYHRYREAWTAALINADLGVAPEGESVEPA